jgi:acyl-CoA thioester hydrolase
VHLSCDFKYPARLDDCLRVGVYFTRFGVSSIGISFDVLHVGAGQLAAAGREVLVCVDRETMRPRPLPVPLRDLLQPFLVDQDAARRHVGLGPQG